MTDSFDELFDMLITSGAVEFSAMGENGEPLYSYTDKMADIFPSIASAITNAFQNDIMQLWALGFIEMDVTEQNPVVKLTQDAVDNDLVNELPEDLRNTLNTIKNAMLT